MRNGVNDVLSKNIRNNIGIYFIVTLFFCIGIAAGAFTVKALDYNSKQELVSYLNRFFQIIDGQSVNNNTILLQSIKSNFQTIFFIWLLSITVIGVPITLLITSFRGFIIGFTISFLIQGLGWKGIFFTLIAILPQNIIYIPCLLIISAVSLSFSLGTLKKKFKQGMMNGTKISLATYTTIVFGLFLIMCLGSLFEAYISPALLKSISAYMTKQ